MAKRTASAVVWTRSALALGAVLVIGSVVWPVAGPAWAVLFAAIGLSLLLLHHLRNVAALLDWLSDPSPGTIPDGSGVWERVFSALYKQTRLAGQQQFKLATLLARFRSAGQAMPDGVLVLDAENRIEWANSTAERFFSIDTDQDQGQPIANLVRHPDFLDFLEREQWGDPIPLRLPGPEEIALSIRIVPYGQDERLMLARDVTRWEKIETMRRDFVANVSHELKTPLTVLAGFQEMLADGTVPVDSARGRQSLALMQAQTERMLRLVDDLLTLSALESTDAPASEAAIEIAPLLAALTEEARALSAGRHQIAVSVDEDASVTGNEQELRSAFGNLVSNAVRYTPAGGRITLAWERRGTEGVFSVQDTGIGIEREHLPRVTERFYRVDRSRSRETGGTGLGLAIVKHVLTRHQATLEIESEVGRGSRFSVIFPARRARFRQPVAAA